MTLVDNFNEENKFEFEGNEKHTEEKDIAK